MGITPSKTTLHWLVNVGLALGILIVATDFVLNIYEFQYPNWLLIIEAIFDLVVIFSLIVWFIQWRKRAKSESAKKAP